VLVAVISALLIGVGLVLAVTAWLDHQRDVRSELERAVRLVHHEWGPLAVACALAGALLGYLARDSLGMALGVALMGVLLPWARAARAKRRRLVAIDRGVADAAGLVAVTVRAGLGIDAAIELTANELDGPLGDELGLMSYQSRLGMTRLETLEALRDRCSAPNVDRLVATLMVADQMGSPVATALSALSEDCRERRYQEAREAAAKLPVKIMFPVVFLIFPPMLVVLLGPAIADIARAFSS
jgi:tight adherence protein C